MELDCPIRNSGNVQIMTTSEVSSEWLPGNIAVLNGPASKRRVKRANGNLSRQATLELDGDDVYCICRKPDDGRWMIACDMCDEWFHGNCIDMNPSKSQLVVKFSCPGCQAKGLLGTWRKKCRLDECFNPARVQEQSKYCCDEHGVLFFSKKVEPQSDMLRIVRPGELATVVANVEDYNSFKSLGNQPKSDGLSTENESPPVENRVNDLMSLRRSFLEQARERQKELSKEATAAAGGKKKDICGYCRITDSGLSSPCMNEKKKCLKHMQWLRLAADALSAEETLMTELK